MLGNQANFFQSLGWAVLNSLWQMALLWVILQFILAVMAKSARPSLKSLLATIFLFTGFAWFVYTFLAALGNSSAGAAFTSLEFSGKRFNGDLNNLISRSLPVAAILYLVLLIGPVSGFIRNYRYVQVIRKYGLEKINVEWRMYVMKIAARLGIKKPVHIWISEYVTSPVTVGFLKPMILVPMAAINHLSPQQLEAVLLHELSHIRRYDYLLNLVLNSIQTILYFNPFVKAFVKVVEREREKSCDEMVLQFQYNSFEYASALLTLEKANYVPKVLTMASGGKRDDLLQRIEKIMGVKKKQAFSFSKVSGFISGILCIFIINGLIILGQAHKTKVSASLARIVSYPATTNQNSKPVNNSDFASLKETNHPGIINSVHPKTEEPTSRDEVVNHGPMSDELSADEMAADISLSLKPVVFETAVTPELKEYQKEQVRKAIEDSRKVLESAQWKILESNIADVFTEKEKEELKSAYRDEINKFDWGKWENRLKLAYENVDWNKVNYQLTNAVNQIRIDSLQKVYTNVIVKLNDVKKELALKKMDGIPDSDITLKEVEKKKNEALRALNELRLIRNKKVVHL
ncbi:MAG TPA: M56 family metallopeptidase [Chitinophagaceae bacterium]|nr:M56 family metallopeptidase [Chitinophagaceae bacterium]